MAKGKKLAVDPLSRTLFDQVFPSLPQRSQKSKQQILEAAIYSFAHLGLEESTPARIAQQAGLSRPLLLHYYASREELFRAVVIYIRAHFQKMAVDAIQSAPSEAPAQLTAYVESTFDWIARYPDQAKVWSLFLYYCCVNKDFHALNSELAAQGHARIMALLKIGQSAGAFGPTELPEAAKLIQLAITGALTVAFTESLPFSVGVLRRRTIDLCLEIAGAKRAIAVKA